MTNLIFAVLLSLVGGQNTEAGAIIEQARPVLAQDSVGGAYEKAVTIGAREYCRRNARRVSVDYQTCYTLLTMQAGANARDVAKARTWGF